MTDATLSTARPDIMRFVKANIRDYALLISLLAIMVFFQFKTDGILFTPLNMTNIILQNSYIVIMAVGMLLIIVAGHIDLSVGFLSGFIGAIAGVMIALSFNSIQFMMGEPYMLKAFVVVVLGGLGNLAGAVVASLLLGVAQAMAAAYLPAGLADILIFATLFVVLIFKPNGLFGGSVAPAGVGRQ